MSSIFFRQQQCKRKKSIIFPQTYYFLNITELQHDFEKPKQPCCILPADSVCIHKSSGQNYYGLFVFTLCNVLSKFQCFIPT